MTDLEVEVDRQRKRERERTSLRGGEGGWRGARGTAFEVVVTVAVLGVIVVVG